MSPSGLLHICRSLQMTFKLEYLKFCLFPSMRYFSKCHMCAGEDGLEQGHIFGGVKHENLISNGIDKKGGTNTGGLTF